MTRRLSISNFGSLSGLFTLAFAGCAGRARLCSGISDLPDSVLGTTLGVGVVVGFAIAGVSERTMQPEEFHTAGGGLSALANGIATAAAFLSAGAVLGLAAAAFSDYRAGIAILLGWSLGFLLLALLIAPYLRKSGTFGRRRLPRLPLRQSRRSAGRRRDCRPDPLSGSGRSDCHRNAGHRRLFALSPHVAAAIVVLLILSGTVLGGMRSVTLSALAQFIVLAIAFVVPVAIVSTIAYSLPVAADGGGAGLSRCGGLAASGDLAATAGEPVHADWYHKATSSSSRSCWRLPPALRRCRTC